MADRVFCIGDQAGWWCLHGAVAVVAHQVCPPSSHVICGKLYRRQIDRSDDTPRGVSLPTGGFPFLCFRQQRAAASCYGRAAMQPARRRLSCLRSATTSSPFIASASAPWLVCRLLSHSAPPCIVAFLLLLLPPLVLPTPGALRVRPLPLRTLSHPVPTCSDAAQLVLPPRAPRLSSFARPASTLPVSTLE